MTNAVPSTLLVRQFRNKWINNNNFSKNPKIRENHGYIVVVVVVDVVTWIHDTCNMYIIDITQKMEDTLRSDIA